MNIKLVFTLFSFRKELVGLILIFTLIIFVFPFFLLAIGTNYPIEEIPKLEPFRKAIAEISRGGNIRWPVTGVVTCEYKVICKGRVHTGIDIAGSRGDSVYPYLPGKVVYVSNGYDVFGRELDYGKHIDIYHGDSTTRYAHLDKINVGVNQEVTTDDIIGLRGSTGDSTGPHLHFEVRIAGFLINPRLVLEDKDI